MSDAAPAVVTRGRMRLICQNTVPPRGALYPVDANPYSLPACMFRLDEFQELPRIHPGDIVEVEPAPPDRPAVVHAGGLDIPVTGASPGRAAAPLFAERGAVLAHPAIVGWQPDWRYAKSVSIDPVAYWRRRLRNNLISFWVVLVAFVAFVALFIVLIIRSHGSGVGGGGGSGGAGGVAALSWWRAHKSRQALNEAAAARAAPIRDMWMFLRWTAGHGLGPVGVAYLREYDSAADAHPWIDVVPLVNVPDGFDPQGWVHVQVRGDPQGAPVIVVDGVELWPKERAHLVR